MNSKYCLDTSLLINAWNKRYRMDVEIFKPIWQKLGALIASGVARVPWEVFREIKKQRDALLTWVEQYKDMIKRPSEDEQMRMLALMARFPNLAAQGGSINAADPWVIVLAQAEDLVVVTDENPQDKARRTKPPKIPFVCDALRIDWMTPIDFLAEVMG